MTENTGGFRGPQVCKIVGITYRQLDYWARTDLIRPSIVDAQGSGSQRMYSYNDLVRIKIIKQMLDAGIKLHVVREALAYLQNELGEEISNANVVIDGHRVYLAKSDNEVVDLLKQGQGVLNIVPLSGTHIELDAAIESLVQPDQLAEQPKQPVPSGRSRAQSKP